MAKTLVAVVGGLAFAKARGLISRLLGCPRPGVSYKNGTHSGKTGRKAVSEHAELSEVGTGRPQAVRHNDHPVPIPALRPRNHLFHPLLWPDGRKSPFPGGCLTMQTKTPYIPTREQKSAVPLGNFDVMEDGNTLVNRLYYAVPRFE